jgi:hypothetical protein
MGIDSLMQAWRGTPAFRLLSQLRSLVMARALDQRPILNGNVQWVGGPLINWLIQTMKP